MVAADAGALIAVDWGTSRLRAMLVDPSGTVVADAASSAGIGVLKPGEHEAAFEALVADWPPAPAIMAGMIGSRQGWREAPYVACPATADTIMAEVMRFETAGGRHIAIVPGVVVRSPERDGDVIRGEETQMVGLICQGFEGLAILPGTHSKWATIAGGAIADFQTFLTGELFDLLAHRSFLRHSVAAEGGDLDASPDFALGVRRTVSDGLPFLSGIFSVRVRYLLDDAPPDANLAYLSGLVIGGEIAAARASGRLPEAERIGIVGARSLARAYRRAFEIAGHRTEALDGRDMVLAGLITLAREIGLLARKDRP